MSLDTQTLIHVGTELVVVGGIAFWLNKRIGTVDAKCDELLKKLAAYEEIISRQNTLIQRHEQIFQRMLGGALPPGPAPQGQPPGNPPGHHPGQPTPSQNQPTAPSPPHSPPPRVEVADQDDSSETEEPVDPDLTPSQLDDLLKQELGQIPSSKSKALKSKTKKSKA